MTDSDLEAVIARTGHERYRPLTSDANPDAVQRNAYRELVARLAAGDPPAPPSLLQQAGSLAVAAAMVKPSATFDELRRATKLGSGRCWFSVKDTACGCNGLQCHLLHRRITIYDCVGCLGRW